MMFMLRKHTVPNITFFLDSGSLKWVFSIKKIVIPNPARNKSK